MKFFACLLLSSLLLCAQKDFLTADEVDKVREVQEPNARLQLYVHFAKQRMDQLKQAVAKDKKGRSLLIRELLEQYSQIIDAIDTVSDDALKRHVDITTGAAAVSQAEKRFLETLGNMKEKPPADFDLYDVAFREAFENTKDSIEQATGDLNARQNEVIEKADKEKAEIKSVLTVDEAKERKAEEKKLDQGEDGKPVRKPPTLYRPGEKPDTTTTPVKKPQE